MILLVALVLTMIWTWKAARSTTQKALTLLTILPYMFVGSVFEALVPGVAGFVLAVAGQVAVILLVAAMGGRYREQAMRAALLEGEQADADGSRPAASC